MHSLWLRANGLDWTARQAEIRGRRRYVSAAGNAAARRASALALGEAVQSQRRGLVPVTAVRPHMLVGDRAICAVFQDAVERHGVPASNAVIVTEPGNHLAGLRCRIEAAGAGFVEQLLWRLAGLRFDRVEVGLIRHCNSLPNRRFRFAKTLAADLSRQGVRGWN